MIKWRKHPGEEGMEWLLTTVLESAVNQGVVDRRSLAHVCIDSTVMEKHIAHPTDSALLEGMRAKLVSFIQAHQLGLRQSYSRQGPRLAQQVGRYAHAKQFKRMRRSLKRQCTWVVRLHRALQRQLGVLPAEQQAKGQELITLTKRVIAQAKNPKQNNKLYSLHEQGVDCISKGKAHKRYE